MEVVENDKKWTYARKKLLPEVRLKNEGDFTAKRKKRTVLWEKVLREIKEVDGDFPFSRDDVTRKFLNFMVTYKRIKKRNNTLGEAATTWEFYDEMDEVYGSPRDICVPEEVLDSSLISILSDENVDITVSVDEPSTSEPRKKRSKCEILNFFKEEAKTDKEVANQLIILEKEKLEVEKEKLEEMRKLRNILCGLTDDI